MSMLRCASVQWMLSLLAALPLTTTGADMINTCFWLQTPAFGAPAAGGFGASQVGSVG